MMNVQQGSWKRRNHHASNGVYMKYSNQTRNTNKPITGTIDRARSGQSRFAGSRSAAIPANANGVWVSANHTGYRLMFGLTFDQANRSLSAP